MPKNNKLKMVEVPETKTIYSPKTLIVNHLGISKKSFISAIWILTHQKIEMKL